MIPNDKDEIIHEKVYPFSWYDHETEDENDMYRYSVTLSDYDDKYKKEESLFDYLENGHNWTALAEVFIKNLMPELSKKIDFDSEFSTFVAISNNKDDLIKFISEFKRICLNGMLFNKLMDKITYLSNAEIDAGAQRMCAQMKIAN
jgi:hypothetical protein